MAVGSGRSTPGSEIQKNEIFIDFHDLTSTFATKLDCQLVQVLMFCSCSCPLHEQGAGWLFEIISISEYEFDLNQDGGQSSYFNRKKVCAC